MVIMPWQVLTSGNGVTIYSPVLNWGLSSLTDHRYQMFPGLRQPGCGTDHPLPSSAKVKEGVEL